MRRIDVGVDHPRGRSIISTLGVLVVGGVAALSIGTGPNELSPAPVVAPKEAPAQDLVELVKNEMNLRSVDLTELDVPTVIDEVMFINVTIDDVPRALKLKPHSVRAAGFEVLEQLADGTLQSVTPAPAKTVRGEVLDMPGTIVAGGITDDGLTATIFMPDGDRQHIEPIARIAPGASRKAHAIYSDMDIDPLNAVCGMNEFMPADGAVLDLDEALTGGGGGGGLLECTELACDADTEFSAIWGGTNGTTDRIETVINSMNVQYENQTNITHLITTVIVRTAEPDPYTSNSSGTLLSQFRDEWLQNQGGIVRDVAKLFTGKSIAGTTIGQAWTIGGICTTSAYCHSQNSFNGSFACSTDLAAHELGHLWGAFHCNGGCSATMNSSITCTNTFTQTSINSITAHANSRTCLGICDGPEDGVTSLPFFDDFDTGTLDPTLWTGIDEAFVDQTGVNEPSGAFSLRINGSDEVRSARMDTTTAFSVTVSYFWQRTGGGNSPENNEDLIVEYRSDNFTWETIAIHPGAGSDTDPYNFESFQLPSDAFHDLFRIRFRGESGNVTGCGGIGCDDYFIDSVGVDVIAIPTGDACQFAPPVAQGANPFTNIAAATEGFSEPCGNFEADVWVRYVTECDGMLNVSVCDADFDVELAIYGVLCPFSPDQAIACSQDDCNGDGATLSIPVNAGELYRFRIGGVNGAEGNGTLVIDCQPMTDPTGACCFISGSCIVVTATECSNAGGSYEGDGTICDPNPCPQPTGACCMTDGSCVTVSDGDCTTMGGNYQGNGSSCSPNPCPQPTGACCFDDGSCVEDVETSCTSSGGSYTGNGSVCSPNPCPQPTGACCFGDGSCTVDTSAGCATAGGVYEGDGTDCSPNPCAQPVGACCFADGSCMSDTQTMCQTMGGVYEGDATICSPNPCPQPTGACCLPDGMCLSVTEVDCGNSGGVYQGDGASCTPNPCDQPAPPCPTDSAPDNGDGTFGNGVVNIDDLLDVINRFGEAGGPADSAPDNGDGTFGNGIVNIDDLLNVINSFGDCPSA
ncbi:MAG: M12 family metallo-peptidase [Planctomycetota bacterium]